ncbi:sigma-70 family RNA polymerase sigma factor [Paracoccus fistulariae]|uniref:Sigma-70 family RNA polymerase sigma factor n=1 Tax=Paracoccus fistulariae TaxID=658446 RepID=A0ABY7SK26_9RHOB|nr:sigma-70 family RNA polymerase sigma factor [Paracoccus fistulariae]MDB6180860.1 sigma-70 family RNA polymerase sigma factor [Paracoccus fistulariae]WCR06923.1 sigma-70 family RNA polymerase sigma factor [Paracoccus fistulariae]
MTASDDLAALLARVALRDRAAFSALYQAASPKLFGICLRILRNKPEAEDALQDIFVKIWHNADRYAASRSSPYAWLNTVARNHAIDLLRARKPGGGDLDLAEQLAADEPSPEESVINASEGRRIDACMEQLPPQRGEAVRLAYVEGDSYIELAERFSVPLNTMRSWLRRSLIQLRECLSHG